MTRLINADELQMQIDEYAEHIRLLKKGKIPKAELAVLLDCKACVDKAPTVDAVPVIRCKECRYWLPHTQFGYDEDNGIYHNYCELLVPEDEYYAFTREANDYCSKAERKEPNTHER